MIGIIGTAGRGIDGMRLRRETFSLMSTFVKDIVNNRLQVKCDEVELISGGAAWADHLAVHHFINGCGRSLSLALPCRWDVKNKRFEDTNSSD